MCLTSQLKQTFDQFYPCCHIIVDTIGWTRVVCSEGCHRRIDKVCNSCYFIFMNRHNKTVMQPKVNCDSSDSLLICCGTTMFGILTRYKFVLCNLSALFGGRVKFNGGEE